ncbi:MAG: ABC transporter ATP-binding protein/permease [Oscillospiraceae bacterium]|nr:ABC transporter ATP-binding protein/permease [Oscillospiraceae bacterium]
MNSDKNKINLEKERYKTFDAIRFVLKVSPVCTVLHFLMSITHAIMPTAAMALATANFVDTATAILHGERLHDDIYLPLIILLIVMGIFTTIGSVTQLISARIRLKLQQTLKPAIVERNAALDFKYIENAESWELISRVSRDPVNSVMEGFGAIMSFMQVIICIAAVLILIVTQVWWAALIIIAFSTPMIWLSIRAGKKNYQAGRDAEKFNRRHEYLNEVLTGRDAVDERTLFGYGKDVSNKFYEQYEAGRKLQLKVTLKMFIITKGSSLILVLIALLIALTLIGSVVSGELSAGMFMGIMSAVFGMVQQLGWQLSGSLENISKVREYMKDLTEFVELGNQRRQGDGSPVLVDGNQFMNLQNASGKTEEPSPCLDILCAPDAEPPVFLSLEFRNVSFQYPSGDRLILDGLSFSLEAGRHYAFVGKNGAGKTTITKLLTGLYTQYEGEILINGKELREYPSSTLKALFSVVYQDFAKYYVSLKDNIKLGDAAGESNDERVADIATKAGLDEIIAELKEEMDTPLGKILENGQDVSGGEWQRIAIARSLISRAPVKMLDEPTAALDPISESRVYNEFEKLMQDKTTVFISHRLGSTKLADEILVIDDGKIIERGRHDELMDLNGLYAEMFEAQRGWYQ